MNKKTTTREHINNNRIGRMEPYKWSKWKIDWTENELWRKCIFLMLYWSSLAHNTSLFCWRKGLLSQHQYYHHIRLLSICIKEFYTLSINSRFMLCAVCSWEMKSYCVWNCGCVHAGRRNVLNVVECYTV